MKKIPRKPRRSAGFSAAAAILVVALLVILAAGFNVIRFAMTRFADNFFHPFIKISSPPERLSDSSLLMQDKGALAAAVEKLTVINRELALQSQAASGLLEENRRLRDLAGLTGREPEKFIIGEIVLRDPLRFRESFTVGRGRNDGVIPGAAVVEVTSSGELLLVGVVSEAGGRSCKVETVANNSLRISGRVSPGGVIGFTNSGDATPPHSRISFGMLPARDDYIHGAVVSTTGFERGIPEGIKIGELYTVGAKISYSREDFSCEMIPSASFGSLRFVAIAKIPESPEEQLQ